MRRSLSQYLWDLQNASESILALPRARASWITSPMECYARRSSASSRFIGEALRQMHDHYPDYMQKVYESRKIIDFRNVLIHKYASVDDVEVWSLVGGKLPLFHQQILALIEEHRTQFPDEYT